MNGMKRIWAFLVMCLFLGSAAGANAAGYTLSCEPARGDAINIVLTGFNFKVMGSSEAATGMGAGRAAGEIWAFGSLCHEQGIRTDGADGGRQRGSAQLQTHRRRCERRISGRGQLEPD